MPLPFSSSPRWVSSFRLSGRARGLGNHREHVIPDPAPAPAAPHALLQPATAWAPPWSTACQTDHVAAGPRVVVRHLTASVACGAMLLTILWPGSTSLLLFLPRTTIQSQVPECFYWFSELVKCPCVATGAQIYFPITCILIFLESISKSFNTSVLISVRYNSYFDD
jgi:hypothetical protein